jgi:hypothetical protein
VLQIAKGRREVWVVDVHWYKYNEGQAQRGSTGGTSIVSTTPVVPCGVGRPWDAWAPQCVHRPRANPLQGFLERKSAWVMNQ